MAIHDLGYDRCKVLVIGLDAATFDVMRPLLDSGQLPHLRRLMESGSFGTLQSTMPPLSPAAWVSAMTGRNPGQHGVFDFRHLDLSTLHGRKDTLVSSREYAGTTVFDLLGRRGLRVGAFNIPLTYPAWPINGVMVSGPITPDHRQAYTHPPELGGRLGLMARHTSPEHLQSFGDAEYLEELIWDTQTHFHLGLQLLEEEGPFDLFWFHLHTIDSVQHRFWRYIEPADPKYGEAIAHLYRLADQGVGQLLAKLGPGSTVFVISDHGARGKAGTELRVNAWLQRQGLLSAWGTQKPERYLRLLYRKANELLPDPSQRLIGKMPAAWQSCLEQLHAGGVKWNKTKAWFFPLTDPVGGLVVNLIGRQPTGCVANADYESVRKDIVTRLKGLQDPKTARQIIKGIWYREDMYPGPFTEYAPDIVFVVDSTYHLSGNISGPWLAPTAVSETEAWSGVHDMDGIFIANGPNIVPGQWIEGATIRDVAPTLLYAMEGAIPSDMGGRVLFEVFTTEWKENHHASYCNPLPLLYSGEDLFSERETESMMSRLRGLGYVE